MSVPATYGHFTDESESPWSLHFKHSHWWKRQLVQILFTLRLRDQWSMWMQYGCKVYMTLNVSCFIVTWTIFNIHLKLGDHATPNVHNHWFIVFYHAWGPAWIGIHRNSIWWRAQSHMTSHHTWWGSVTTWHDFGGALGWPLDTFFWDLTIPWSRHLGHLWSGLQCLTISPYGTRFMPGPVFLEWIRPCQGG